MRRAHLLLELEQITSDELGAFRQITDVGGRDAALASWRRRAPGDASGKIAQARAESRNRVEAAQGELTGALAVAREAGRQVLAVDLDLATARQAGKARGEIAALLKRRSEAAMRGLEASRLVSDRLHRPIVKRGRPRLDPDAIAPESLARRGRRLPRLNVLLDGAAQQHMARRGISYRVALLAAANDRPELVEGAALVGPVKKRA